MSKLVHGLPARCWKSKKHRDDMTPKERDVSVALRSGAVRILADELAEVFSDELRQVSARQVLDRLESLWPHECRCQLAKGQQNVVS